ncbi:MAG: cation transporter [Bacteroidales bacterium]|jgi:Cu(I)/Ag(I) efflux system membrane fusion protein|nr:cation transporter [Bacteroidales bacterium]
MKKLIYLVILAFLTAIVACSNAKTGDKQQENATDLSGNVHHECTHSENAEAGQPAGQIDLSKGEKAILRVQGNCKMCKTHIEKAAGDIEGVLLADWDLDAKELRLQYESDKVSLEAISKAIAKVGYDTEKDKAGNDVYNALPECCKYRK